MFNKQFIDAVEYVKDVGTCNYKFRYDVCVDGHVRHTMAYDTISILGLLIMYVNGMVPG